MDWQSGVTDTRAWLAWDMETPRQAVLKNDKPCCQGSHSTKSGKHGTAIEEVGTIWSTIMTPFQRVLQCKEAVDEINLAKRRQSTREKGSMMA